MNKKIEIKAAHYVTEYYDHEYTERDFYADVERYKIEGISWEDLIGIFEDKFDDIDITYIPWWDQNGVRRTSSARDFFYDVIQEDMWDCGPIDSDGDGCDIDIEVIDYELH